jgi:dipeptidyl aminopeptidase/acylaminoacyl peptidase
MLPRVLALSLLFAASAAAAEPHSARELFKPPLYRSYALSPDGRYLVETALADKSDADRVEQLRTTEDLLKLRLPDQKIFLTDLQTKKFVDLTVDRAGRWSFAMRWLDAKTFLWQTVDRRRGERSIEVFSVSNDAQGDVAVSPARVFGKNATVMSTMPDAKGRMLVVQDDKDGESVYRADPSKPLYLQTTPANRVAGPLNGVQRWVADARGEVVAVGLLRRADELRIMVRADGRSPWRKLATLPLTDSDFSELVGSDATSGALLVITDHGTDKSVLRLLDPATGALGKIIIGDPRNDVSGEYRDPRDDRVIGAQLNDNSTRIHFLDQDVARLQAEAARLLPRTTPRVVNFSADRQHAVVFTGQSDDPGRYYYLSIAQRRALLIESAAPWLDGKKFAHTEAIELKTRDGLQIYGQFTRPPDATKPPLVLMPHGGPFGIRDYLYYDPDVQFLASRGYAVLQVDFRGSGGYGREYKEAGFKRWGAEMQYDLLDALDWVAARGWIDPARVCVYGASYGGYAAMMSLMQNPERFRCGITYAGVSDLTLLLRSEELRDLPFDQERIFDYLRKVIGDPEKERAALQARSPAYIAKGIKRPVFIAHGDKDERADPEHAWRLRAAIEAGGGRPSWFLAKDEGHGFRLAENIDAFYGQLEAFLKEHLAPTSAAAPAGTTP